MSRFTINLKCSLSFTHKYFNSRNLTLDVDWLKANYPMTIWFIFSFFDWYQLHDDDDAAALMKCIQVHKILAYLLIEDKFSLCHLYHNLFFPCNLFKMSCFFFLIFSLLFFCILKKKWLLKVYVCAAVVSFLMLWKAPFELLILQIYESFTSHL